jgi:NADPH:quinone reductase
MVVAFKGEHMAKAVRIHQYGGPEVLTYEDVEIGDPGPGEVRIRNRAVGVNYIDTYYRIGMYPSTLPVVLGNEAAGEVVAVGDGVTDLKRGDRVAYVITFGGYAEERIAPAKAVVKLPDGISDETAAAMMLKGMTAQYLLNRTYKVKHGDTILFHAAAGGVGSIACQWAKHLGATVIGTSRSADKLARALVYGLDSGIDTSRTSFREALTEPVDVVLDAIGGPAFGDNLAVLAPKGRLVLLGFLAGSRTTADLGPMVRKRLEVIGPSMRVRSLEERKALIADFAERMLPLFDRRIEQAAPLRPVLQATYPMTRLAEAHRVMESNETFGKIVAEW